MLKKLLIAVIAVTALSSTAHAFNLGSTRSLKPKATSISIPAPIAYQRFCENNPAECRGSRRSIVTYSGSVEATLAKVNAAVNRSIRPKQDAAERWSLNPASGDCEDYALTKRSQLIRAGIPAGALRMASVITPRGLEHAVLLVNTDKGELVLDNLRGTILKRNQTGYRFVGVASANPRHWQLILPGRGA